VKYTGCVILIVQNRTNIANDVRSQIEDGSNNMGSFGEVKTTKSGCSKLRGTVTNMLDRQLKSGEPAGP
jgi:hypothetical protein